MLTSESRISLIERSPIKLWLTAVIISSLYVLAFSNSATPLYPYVNLDQAFWYVIGRGMHEGLIPYRDLYDHKGPLLYCYYYLATFFSEGKWGLYILEILTMSVSLCFVYKMSRLFVSAAWGAASVLVYLIWHLATCAGDATNESLSQFFVWPPLYFLLKYSFSKEGLKAVSPWLGVSIGLCGGCIAMIRMNNAACLFAAAGVLLFLRWKEVSFSAMLTSLVQMFIGLIAVTVPFFAYFYIHGALDYFLQAYFLHNFAYASGGTFGLSIKGWCMYALHVMPVFFLLPLLYYACKKAIVPKDTAWILGVSCTFCAGILSFGAGYSHYFLILSPAVLAAFWLSIRLIQESVKAGSLSRGKAIVPPLFLCVLFVLPYTVGLLWGISMLATRAISYYSEGQNEYQSYWIWAKNERPRQAAVTIREAIPQEDRGEIWIYNSVPNTYYDMGIIPYFRYFALQRSFARTLPKIRQEIDEMLLTNPPKYIMTKGKGEPDTLRQVIRDQYSEWMRSPDMETLPLIVYKRKY